MRFVYSSAGIRLYGQRLIVVAGCQQPAGDEGAETAAQLDTERGAGYIVPSRAWPSAQVYSEQEAITAFMSPLPPGPDPVQRWP